MAYAINEKALSLLLHLREDSRKKLTDISKNTRIPVSTLFDMLKILQESVIKKSTILLDFSALGYNAHACILLKAGKEGKEALRKHLVIHPSVNSVFKINNEWDFLIETVHKDLRELDEFIEEIEQHGIEDKKIHYLIDEIKKEDQIHYDYYIKLLKLQHLLEESRFDEADKLISYLSKKISQIGNENEKYKELLSSLLDKLKKKAEEKKSSSFMYKVKTRVKGLADLLKEKFSQD